MSEIQTPEIILDSLVRTLPTKTPIQIVEVSDDEKEIVTVHYKGYVIGLLEDPIYEQIRYSEVYKNSVIDNGLIIELF